MAKLREAAIVAAVVGSVSMIGAGAASAHDVEAHGPVYIKCIQNVGDDSNSTGVASLVTINGPLLSGGRGDADANQQLCGLNNEDAENTSGEGTGGTGGVLGDVGL
ncbi:hypothetical protein [Streptomyces winkii]|uniref:hypothetical protein n=1 Tax=Streptomyces winkii TaxID=3051178 RepID=UPI0028D4CABE|nr:hypothetical protein [Streptomyces sp. DSM 40971]